MSHLPIVDCQGQLGRAPPTNLYDLLGARPDGDAEELKIAFRRALKASHPDLHPGDPDAPVRASGIVRAYAILRDPHERAAYDRALGLGREPFRPKRRRIFNTMRTIISESVAIVVLAVVLGAGYALLAEVLETSLAGYKLADVTLHEPADISILPPVLTSRTGEQTDEPEGGAAATVAIASSLATPTAKSDDALAVANGKPTPSRPGRDVEAAKVTENSKSPTNLFKKNHEVERPDRYQARPTSVRVELSSMENEKKTAKSSDFEKSGEKHHVKTRDLRAPAIHGRSWAVATGRPDHILSHRPRVAMRRHFPVEDYSIHVTGHSTGGPFVFTISQRVPDPGVMAAEHATFGVIDSKRHDWSGSLGKPPATHMAVHGRNTRGRPLG